VRRSRRRFQKPENGKEKNEAAQTLYLVLLNLAKLAAPFIPFLSEEIYLGLKKSKMPESVHLCDYPLPNKKLINKKLEEKMAQAREVVVLALAQRAAAGIKVRQPLAMLEIKNQKSLRPELRARAKIKNDKELLELIREEVNVRQISFNPELKSEIKLDKRITKELREEGMAREVARQIQDMRKEAGLTRKDTIFIAWQSSDKILSGLMTNWTKYFQRENLAREILPYDKKEKYLLEKDLKIEDGKIKLAIRK
jgi:isoleucyl-tRNA synthetase